MRRVLFVLVTAALLLGARPARAQPAADPACSPDGRAVARFAARASRWPTRLPTARPVAALGRGRIWVVTDNPACCAAGGCAARSERPDALVGVVGRRMFALTRAQPPRPASGAPAPASPRSWHAAAWSAFVAASGARPADDAAATDLACTVVAGFWPELAPLAPAAAVAPVAAQLDALLRRVGAVRSGASARAGGWDATCWLSGLAPRVARVNLRERGAGLPLDMLLVRAVVRLEAGGAVRLVSTESFAP